jgi:WD40 repeat protein
MATQPQDARYPDCIAVRYDEVHERVACIYNDHSVYVWDVANKNKIGKSHSFLFHSSCIWGIEGYPTVGDGVKALLPFGTFFTCASDDTIRIWNLDPKMANNTLLKRNLYSNVSINHANVRLFIAW